MYKRALMMFGVISRLHAVEIQKIEGTEQNMPSLTAAELSLPLESMLGRRVVVDRGASAVLLNLKTMYALKPDEVAQYARMQIHAAGLMVIDTELALVIGKPEDEGRLRGIATGLVGEAGKEKRVIQLQYIDNDAACRMLGKATQSPMVTNGLPEARQSGGAMTSGGQLALPPPTIQQDDPIGVNMTGSVKSFDADECRITSDAPNRQIIVYGERGAVNRVAGRLKDVDRRPQEVIITATIAEYQKGRKTTFGMDWASAMRKAGLGGIGGIQSTRGETPTGVISRLQTSPLSGVTIYGSYGEYFTAALTAMEDSTNFKVVQRPTISTMNDTPARIYVGQQIPIAKQTLTQGGTNTSNTSLAATTEYIPVRLQLDVTPHIYSNREVKLTINEKQNDVGSYIKIGGNDVPSITEQGMTNTVIVKDGHTVMLGGLSTGNNRRDSSGVPVLARIPVVGFLFGTKTRDNMQKEIIVMLTVSISGAADDREGHAMMHTTQPNRLLTRDDFFSK